MTDRELRYVITGDPSGLARAFDQSKVAVRSFGAEASNAVSAVQKRIDALVGMKPIDLGGGLAKSAGGSAAVFEELRVGAARLRAEMDPTGAQIERISDLYRRGAISASEFAAAQARAWSTHGRSDVFIGPRANPYADEIARAGAEVAAGRAQSGYAAVLGLGGASKSAAESASVFEAAARATEEMETKIAALRAQIDPVGTMQAKLNAELAEFRTFAAAGAISAEELVAAEVNAAQKMQHVVAMVQRGSAVKGLSAFEKTNLAMQVNDVLTMAAMGASPFQILATQGGQVYQILANSGGGVTGAVKGLAASFYGLVGPVGLAVGALSAFAGGAYYLLGVSRDTSKALETQERLYKSLAEARRAETEGRRQPGQDTSATVEAQVAANRQLLEKRLKSEGGSLARTIAGQLTADVQQGDFTFDTAYRDYLASVEAGIPKVQAFRDAIGKIASDNPENRDIQRYSGDLLALTEAAAKTEAALKDLSTSIGVDEARRSVLTILPDLERRRDLAGEITLLERARDNPDMLKRMGVTANEVSRALDGLRDAEAGLLPPLERLRVEGDLALRSIMARTTAEKAALAYDQAMAGRRAGEVDPTAEARAHLESQKVYTQAARDAQDRLRAANDNAALAGLPGYSRARAEIERRYAELASENAGNPLALAADAATRNADLAALDRTQILAPLQEANRGLEAQNRLLAVNAATFGMSTDKVVAARVAQEQLNTYIAAGVPITDQLRAGIDAYAQGMGRAALAAEDLGRRQQAVIQGMDDLRGTSKGVFASLLRGDTKGALRTLGDKALDNGAGFITDQLFGKQGKPGGGLFGDALGGLFGKSQGITVGTQQVTAGVVNVGGVGLGGLGGVGGVGGLAGLGGGVGGKPTNLLDFVGGQGDVKAATAALGPIYTGRPGGLEGLDPSFASRLSAFAAANPGVSISSAYRSPEHQAQLWQAALDKYGSADEARKWVAPPGSSMHQKGLAADLSFASPDAMARAHATAGQYGLKFPLSNENWHIEPLGARGGALDASTKALEQFQQTTASAAGGLGTFGDGLGKMGSTLFDGLSGQGGGSGGGLFGALAGLLNFKGMFADGGDIPSGGWGIAGEAGPEIVHGPASVVPFRDLDTIRRPDRARFGGDGMMVQALRQVDARQAVSISIGGSTVHVQGDATAATRDYFTAEMDRRDAALVERVEKAILPMSKRQSVLRG